MALGWEAGPRSAAAELKEAATHYERAAALCSASVAKSQFVGNAAWCRRQAQRVRERPSMYVAVLRVL